MADLISVVVPVYKVEEYIERCIDSILNQTYRELEIILIDDGSPDRCGEICDQYSEIDNRIKVIHKTNGGLSDARNAGIQIARGEYITFLDSDDWIEHTFIEKLYNLIKLRQCDISICNFISTSSIDNAIEELQLQVFEFTNIEALEQLAGDFYVQFVVAWGKLYRRSLLENIKFPTGKIHEDEYIAHKLLFKANKVVYTSECLLYYWQRPDSIMGVGFNIKNRLHLLEALNDRIAFYEKLGLIKSRDKIIKMLFDLYKEVMDNRHLFRDKDEEKRFIIDFNRFFRVISDSKQSFLFMAYYKMYYAFPKLTNVIYGSYRKFKTKSY